MTAIRIAQFYAVNLQCDNYDWFHYFQAQTYVYQRKYNEAESLLLTVMEQSNSSRREVFHQLATLYSQHLNRTNDAFRYLKMAVETCQLYDVTCAPLFALTGDLYKDIDDLDSATMVSPPPSFPTSLTHFLSTHTEEEE